jgi:serine/threonine-protein kinase
MGAVRAARDLVVRREVAVKLLHPALARDPANVQSFVEEALVTGQLTHPNIVPLHDLARDARGTVYFTMQRIAGRTLYDILHDPEIPPGSSERLAMALDVFLKVCSAVAFAHSRGVIHRDIKVSNVMVGRFGEVYLVDWGLAKVLRDRPGAVDVPRGPSSPLGKSKEASAGTPHYMAPEQASDDPCADERSDIFGLGAMLYEIVTGRPPYDSHRPEEIVAMARECNPTPPDRVGDFYVPKKLARVVAKAMAKDPADRYATVEELAAQVREFLMRGHHLPLATFPAGARIVVEGEIGDRAYIVIRGTCEAVKYVGEERRVLRQMGPGSIFGESAILGSAPRTATVEALTEMTVVVITRDEFEERLAPETWEGLLARTLVERFRDLDAKLALLESKEPG